MSTWTKPQFKECLKSLIMGRVLSEEEMEEILNLTWDDFAKCPNVFRRVMDRLEENVH
jgi:hypothetical protein